MHRAPPGHAGLREGRTAKRGIVCAFEVVMDTHAEHLHCTFCDLIRGAAEVSICYEDRDAIAFMDIQPVNNGHVLVVPREHYESLLDVPQEIGMHLFQVTMRIANAVRNVTGSADFNIVVNSGKAAGQDEPHYHVHIIPRRAGDGFDIQLPFNGSEMPDRTLLDAYAARIGSALRDPMKGHSSGSSSGGQHESRKTEPRMQAVFSEERQAMRAERAVAVPTYDEAESANARPNATRSGRTAGSWAIEEGAHGELRYEPVAEAHPAD
jgi:histidine triad (HIT) family protein